MCIDILKKLCTKAKQLASKDPNSIYDHIIFTKVPDTIKQFDKITFVDAAT